MLGRRSVIWGNAAGLTAFVTETSLVFLLTLYLQEVLGYSPLATGLAFGVLGIGTVAGGMLGGRAAGRFGTRRTIVLGGAVQAAATLSLVALGTSGGWIALLLAATFVGGVGNMLMIVGFMVTATSGLPDEEQGRATGLATMTPAGRHHAGHPGHERDRDGPDGRGHGTRRGAVRGLDRDPRQRGARPGGRPARRGLPRPVR